MGNAQLIPVILPDEAIGGGTGSSTGSPFLGHGANILVNSNGTATFYEYGNYVNGSAGVVTINPLLANGVPGGNVRAVNITGTMQFDGSGNITQASLQSALDQVFGAGGLYAGTDPGMVLATPYSLTATQYTNISSWLGGFKANVNAGGIDATYGLFSLSGNPNCINFDYSMAAGAAGTGNAPPLTISTTQTWNDTTSVPSVAGDAILAYADSTGVPSYQYFGPSSWNATNGHSNIQAVTSLANLPAIEDFEVQLAGTLPNFGTFGSAVWQSMGTAGSWISGQLQTTGSNLLQWTVGSSNGDHITATFGGTQPISLGFSNASGTSVGQVAYNTDGSDALTTFNSNNSVNNILTDNSGGTSNSKWFTWNLDGSSSTLKDGYAGLNQNGSQVYQETTNTTTSGQCSVNISGQGDICTNSNASVNLTSGASATIDGNTDTVSAANGDTVTVAGNGDGVSVNSGTYALGAGDTGSFTGSNTNISTGSGATVNVVGQADGIVMSGGTLNVSNNETFWLGGNNNIVNAGNGDTVNLTGGTGTNVNLSSGTLTAVGNQGFTLTGNSDTFTGANGDAMTVAGNNDSASFNSGTFTMGANETDSFTGNNTNISTTTGDTLTVSGNANGLVMNGGTLNMAASETFWLSGGNTTVNAGNGDTANLAGGNGFTINLSSGTLSATSNEGFTLGGNNDNVNGAAGDSITTTGQGDGIVMSGGTLTTGFGETFWLTGTGDTVNAGNNSTVNLASGTSDGINLNSGTLNLSSGETFSLAGNNDAINAPGTSSNTVNVTAGSGGSNTISITGEGTVTGQGDVLSISNTTVTLGNGVTVTVNGSNDNIIEGNNDALSITSGSSDNVTVNGNNSWVTDGNGSGNSITLDGTSDSATGNASGDTIDLNNSSETATLSAGGETVNSSVSGDTINLSATNGNRDTVNASGDTENLGIQTVMDLNGSSNTINGSYDVMDFSGQSNQLNASYSAIQDFNAQGDYLTGWYDMYDGVNEGGYYSGVDPLVLNLTGQKVQTVGIAQSGAFFDVQNSGQRILTGWATAGEGFLVYDPKNTNTVSSAANLVSSFAQLSALDSNHDGVLNSADAAWSSFKVWVDKNGIGNFDSGSLFTLAQLGITSINLKATQENVNSNGNSIVADSTFTFSNGTTGDIAGVNFVNAPDISMGVNGSTAIAAEAAYQRLVQAMAADPTHASSAETSFTTTLGALAAQQPAMLAATQQAA